MIRNTDTGEERLVRAPNAARALAHITRTSYTAEVASQEQLVALLTGEAPAEIEDATREPSAEAQQEEQRDAA
ncbi:MAG TPA: hypothetical protein VN324_07955 [Quisquiliibacterium sp.]|nr:hypothetical protein [Quisquiliibacterium sp.]